MAKLKKRLRKTAKCAANSEFVRDLLEDLVAAALLAAAAKIGESRTADEAKRKARKAVAGKAGTKRRKS